MDTDTIIRIHIGNAYCYSIVLEAVGVYHVPNKKDDNNVVMIIKHGEESIKKLMKLFQKNMFYITITE